MRTALLMLSLAGAAFEPPNTRSCQGKFDAVACRTDNDTRGTCQSRLINTPDFSVPGPPKFSDIPTMVCVRTVPEYAAKDYVGAGVVALVIFAGVIFNMFRKRSLSDYE